MNLPRHWSKDLKSVATEIRLVDNDKFLGGPTYSRCDGRFIMDMGDPRGDFRIDGQFGPGFCTLEEAIQEVERPKFHGKVRDCRCTPEMILKDEIQQVEDELAQALAQGKEH